LKICTVCIISVYTLPITISCGEQYCLEKSWGRSCEVYSIRTNRETIRKRKIDDREIKIVSFVAETCVKVTLKKGYVEIRKLTRVGCNISLIQRTFLGINLNFKMKSHNTMR